MSPIKHSSSQLAGLAQERGTRVNFGSTAVWVYEPLEVGTERTPAVLMVHGFRGDHHGLAAVAAGLAGCRVYIPDLPGYGKTPPLSGRHTVSEYANWLENLLSELGADTHLVGHSFGSLVAAAAVSGGAKVKSLTLMNPIAQRSAEQRDFKNRTARAFYRLSSALGPIGSALMRSWPVVQVMSTAMSTTSDRSLRTWIHGQHHRYFSNYANDAVAIEGFWSASKSSVIDFAADIGVPTLLIAGDLDQIAPLAAQQELLKAMPNTTLHVLSGVGHLIHYERPAEVAGLIDAMVDRR